MKKLVSAKTLRDKKKAKDARRAKRKEKIRMGLKAAAPWPGQIKPPAIASPGPSLAEILTGPVPGFTGLHSGPAFDVDGISALAIMAAVARCRRK
jgi:hypothetical protein